MNRGFNQPLVSQPGLASKNFTEKLDRARLQLDSFTPNKELQMNRKFFPAKLLFVPATTLLLTGLSIMPVQLLQSALAQPVTPETPGPAPISPTPVTPGGSTNALPPVQPADPQTLPQDPVPQSPDGVNDGGGSGGPVVTDPEPQQPTTIPAAYPVRW